ncbi:MAG TPA: carboxypeptidase regulatory-like domain-containing protein [Gammaproteobacteria bacterium]|nr:carboxypeptidase regulatory-like domain-containing protein [Gammaproteobacteria bacterium]
MLWNYRVFILLSALLAPAMVSAIDITISGRIVDRTGNPVQGVRFVVSAGTGATSSTPTPAIPGGLPMPTFSVTESRLFPGVPEDCLYYSSLSALRTNASGDYQLRVIFDESRTVSDGLRDKSCADYQRLITEVNMKLVPHPDDVRRYELRRARGPLPIPTKQTRSKNARKQVLPAGSPAPRGGFAP